MNAASRTAIVTTAVSPGYEHRPKAIEPGALIELAGKTLKWHNLAAPDKGVPLEICDLARQFLHREASAGKLDDLGDLGFVILHRCGEDFYFLLVNGWHNDNELWESVYAKQTADQMDFERYASTGSHRAAFCVWELAAVWHEQQAWKRFLLSPRDENARDKYLQESYRGPA